MKDRGPFVAGDAANLASCPHFSVVVTRWRDAGALVRTLRALCLQDFTPGGWEIIVADGDPTLGARLAASAVQREFGGTVPISYLALVGSREAAEPRDGGWRMARAPLLAFTDAEADADGNPADPAVPADWLSSGWRTMRPGVAAATDQVLVPSATHGQDLARLASALYEARFVTARCIVRASILLAVGGFLEICRQPPGRWFQRGGPDPAHSSRPAGGASRGAPRGTSRPHAPRLWPAGSAARSSPVTLLGRTPLVHWGWSSARDRGSPVLRLRVQSAASVRAFERRARLHGPPSTTARGACRNLSRDRRACAAGVAALLALLARMLGLI